MDFSYSICSSGRFDGEGRVNIEVKVQMTKKMTAFEGGNVAQEWKNSWGWRTLVVVCSLRSEATFLGMMASGYVFIFRDGGAGIFSKISFIGHSTCAKEMIA